MEEDLEAMGIRKAMEGDKMETGDKRDQRSSRTVATIKKKTLSGNCRKVSKTYLNLVQQRNACI